MESRRIFVLRLCYNDSDIMTGYFNRDAVFEDWYIWDFEGKAVTEKKLRDSLKHCPPWVQEISFKYDKSCYGKPYLESGAIAPGFEKKNTYGHVDMPFFFQVEETSSSIFTMNSRLEDPIPRSLEELKKFVEAKEEERRKKLEENRPNVIKAHIKTVQDSYAVIDGRGFHVLTQEDKDKEIKKQLEEVKDWKPILTGEGKEVLKEAETVARYYDRKPFYIA